VLVDPVVAILCQQGDCVLSIDIKTFVYSIVIKTFYLCDCQEGGMLAPAVP
jgi:hypothetical protein